MKSVYLIGAVCIGLGLSAPARADSVQDAVRCDAMQMRKEGQRLVCNARCLSNASRLAAAAVDTTDVRVSSCGQRCDDRYQAALARIQQRPPCDPQPDPNRCAAKLLNAQAREIMCESRCLSEAPDSQITCVHNCDQDYTTAKDEILASVLCQNGVAPTP